VGRAILLRERLVAAAPEDEACARDLAESRHLLSELR
jgi:hypothetical protein